MNAPSTKTPARKTIVELISEVRDAARQCESQHAAMPGLARLAKALGDITERELEAAPPAPTPTPTPSTGLDGEPAR